MNISNIFMSECVDIPLETFMLQFASQINLVVPPETVREYINKPPGVILPFSDVAEKLLCLHTVNEMHAAFIKLTESEKAAIISQLFLFTMEAQSHDPDTTVHVPSDPGDYIRPFLAGTLTLPNILI